MSWLPPAPAEQADHRELLRLRGRPAALARRPARRAAAQRGRGPARRRRPVRGADGLLRADPGARGPGARPALPDRLPRRRGGGLGVPPRSPRAGCATARRPPRSRSSTSLEEAGLPQELTEDGLMIDVELDEPTAETWMRSFTDLRLALATRLEVEEGDEAYWHSLPEDDPRCPGARHLRVGRLPAGDRSSAALTGAAMPIPPFVAELRSLVGDPSCWLPGVTAVVRRGRRAPAHAACRQRRVGAGHRHRRPG